MQLSPHSCRSSWPAYRCAPATDISPAAWRGCAPAASRTSRAYPSFAADRQRAPAGSSSSATRRRQKSWTASIAISLSSVTSSSEKGRPARKRRVGERALAEAVDGEDRGFVEVLQRLVERQGELLGGRARALLDRLHEVRDERVAGRLRPVTVAQAGERFDDARTDALAQLGRGRVGERHDQDLLDLEVRVPAAGAGTARRCSTSCRCRPTPRSG